MSSLDLARWQFGIVTVYHFLFVPLTIGLAPIVAIMQTVWYRNGNPAWLRLTKFFGKLLLINFALGVVTGIVQEFQFGMNWNSCTMPVTTPMAKLMRKMEPKNRVMRRYSALPVRYHAVWKTAAVVASPIVIGTKRK